MIPSKYQQCIYQSLSTQGANIIIKAGPGSGKTTTILECLKLIPKNKKCIFVSFSNTIVNELKSRVPHHVQVSTMHSLGYSFLRRKNPHLKLNNNKYFNYIKDKLFALEKAVEMEHINNGISEKYEKKPAKEIFHNVYKILDIISAIKLTLTDMNEESVRKLGIFYGLDVSVTNINLAISAIKKLNNTDEIDYADMLFKPLQLQDSDVTKYDYVFYDEVQDSNRAQLALVEKIIKRDGRLIAVGDWNQSIYGFSYASHESFEILQKRKNTIVLPLSVCYRCDKNIVLEAQKIYGDIEILESKEEGVVRRGDMSELKQGDIVVCRNTMPLVNLFILLLREGKHSYILGREYGEKLKKYIKKFSLSYVIRDKEIIAENMQSHLDKVEKDLFEYGIRKPKESKTYLDEEEIVSILTILTSLYEIHEMEDNINKMYDESGKDSIKLMTIHKSKGLENDRVFYLDRYDGKNLIPSKYAITDLELRQENNLKYVATTRAKHELVYFEI